MRRPSSLSKWLPSPGNMLFTLIAVFALLGVQNANALRSFSAGLVNSNIVIPVQGRINDTGGPVNGSVILILSLHISQSAPASVFTEVHTQVTVTNGMFSVLMGSVSGSPSLLPIVQANPELWLGMNVNGSVLPRVQLGAAAHALNASFANSATTANYAASAGVATTATNAANAANANFASSAGNAAVAANATYAIFAGGANTATNAINAGTATIANSVVDDAIATAKILNGNITSSKLGLTKQEACLDNGNVSVLATAGFTGVDVPGLSVPIVVGSAPQTVLIWMDGGMTFDRAPPWRPAAVLVLQGGTIATNRTAQAVSRIGPEKELDDVFGQRLITLPANNTYTLKMQVSAEDADQVILAGGTAPSQWGWRTCIGYIVLGQ